LKSLVAERGAGVRKREGQEKIDRTLPNIDAVPAARSQSRHSRVLKRCGHGKHCAAGEFGRVE